MRAKRNVRTRAVKSPKSFWWFVARFNLRLAPFCCRAAASMSLDIFPGRRLSTAFPGRAKRCITAFYVALKDFRLTFWATFSNLHADMNCPAAQFRLFFSKQRMCPPLFGASPRILPASGPSSCLINRSETDRSKLFLGRLKPKSRSFFNSQLSLADND